VSLTDKQIITYAPVVASIGAALFTVSLFCDATVSGLLNLLGLVICSMTLGALLVAYPE
jgi:hypothetical protein